jgi:hypothetical protein
MRNLLVIAALAFAAAASAQAPSASKQKLNEAVNAKEIGQQTEKAKAIYLEKASKAKMAEEQSAKQKELAGIDKQLSELKKRQDAKGDITTEHQQKMQNLVEQRTKAAEQMSKVMKKQGEASSAITSNIK